jgi:hypothetical protein
MTNPGNLPADPRSIHMQRQLPNEVVPYRSGATVWWSNIKREGEWILPRIFRVFTFMGNAELDVTNAKMGEGLSEIEMRCILGNVEILVPPDIHLECDIDGLGRSFEVIRVGEVLPPDPDAPTLRVSGSAYLGSVTVKIMGKVGPGWKDRLKAGWQQLNSSR